MYVNWVAFAISGLLLVCLVVLVVLAYKVLAAMWRSLSKKG
jgi:hypothetical protein